MTPGDCADILGAAANLHKVNDWLWQSSASTAVSYPAGAHEVFAQIEDQSFWFVHRNRCLAALCDRFPPPGVLVDVGGGNGAVAAHLSGEGRPVLLVEPSAEGVLAAHARGLQPIVQSTFLDASFGEATLPSVGMFDTLEHIEDEHATLLLVSHLLVPAGRLYVTVPSFNWLWSAEDDDAGHFRRYSLRRLSEAVSRVGLEVEFASYMFGPLVLPILLLRTLPSALGLRRLPDAARTRREHGLRSGVISRMVRAMLESEARRFSRGESVPFGSSCAIVARKPATQ